MTRHATSTRRQFLARSCAGAGGLAWLAEGRPLWGANEKPLKVAALTTMFHSRSHAHVILENFVQPYLFNGQVVRPNMQVASLFVDQAHPQRMDEQVAEQFKIPKYKTIAEALTLGGDKLAVDAVLLIGEHGDYPKNLKQQVQYPRKEFFDQVVAVFRKSDRGVPVFNDKHLSYRWEWAKEMYDTSRELKFPLMAGSSVPLAEHRPPLELPAGAQIESAVSIHGGGLESYDFHALEVLQSQVEGRAGGETGVREVEFLEGAPLWKAAEAGRWRPDLAAAAMAAELGPDHELVRVFQSRGTSPATADAAIHAILVRYRDGLSAAALKVGSSGIRWNFACQLAGESQPRATAYYVGPWQNRNLFKALSHAIQTFFRAGRAPYPVERTLLVSGVLDAAMEARLAGQPLATPQLAVTYTPQDFRAMREMGATWKIITEQMPEPPGIEPVGIH